MKKLLFCMGFVLVITALKWANIGILLQALFPKVVRNLWYIFGGTFSPEDATLRFAGLYVMCIAAFALGVGVAIYAYRMERKEEKHEKNA